MRADLQSAQAGFRESGRNSRASSSTATVAEAPAVRVAKLWKIAVPALLLALLVAGGLYYRSRHQTSRLTDKDTIVLADFANSTDDVIFDDTLKTALAVSLQQSPFLSVLPDSKVMETLATDDPPGQYETYSGGNPANFASGQEAKPTLPDRLAGLGSEFVIRVEGDQLPERRDAGAGASHGCDQGKGAGRAGRGGIQTAYRDGRIAGFGAAIWCSTRAGHNVFA